jgi:hypothetical protein
LRLLRGAGASDAGAQSLHLQGLRRGDELE